MQNVTIAKARILKKVIPVLFVSIEFTVWVLVLIDKSSAMLQFLSVALALLFALLGLRKEVSVILTAAALTFTVCADYCLVLSEPTERVLGMLFFSFAQLLYAARICVEKKQSDRRRLHIYLRILAVLLLEATMLLILGASADVLTVITAFYFANLLLNAALAPISKCSPLLFAGLLAFIGCDVFVGLDVLFKDYIPLPEASIIHTIIHPPFNIVWFFYIPSQTLIALSTKSTN